MKRRNAFTLIELLVVIAIIAILAAILFPVFAKAREKARQTTCLSNLKQLGLGIIQYEQDYDEWIPIGEESDVSTPALTGCPANSSVWLTYDITTWMDIITPYIKSTDVYVCPSQTFNGKNIYDGGGGQAWGASPLHSYGYNSQVMGFLQMQDPAVHGATYAICGGGGYFATGAQMIAKVTSPATTIMLMDGSISPANGQPNRLALSSPWGAVWNGDGTLNQASTANWIYGSYPTWRHSGFSDTLYADGHAKALYCNPTVLAAQLVYNQ